MATSTIERLQGVAGMLARSRENPAILAGSTWRSRGTAKHQHYPVLVEKLTTAGRVVFVKDKAGHNPNGERRHTLDEAAFRVAFELVKQAPMPRVLRAAAGGVVAVEVGRGTLDLEQFEREMRVHDVVDSLTPPVRPVAPRAQSPAEPEAGAPLGEPEAVTAEAAGQPDGAISQELTTDPVEAFLAQGRAAIEHLDREVTRTEEDRDIARLEVEELDAKLGALRLQRDRVQRAIRAAIAAADAPGVVEVEPVAEEPRRRVVAPRVPKNERGGQRDWVQRALEGLGGERFVVGERRSAFGVAFGIADPVEQSKRLATALQPHLRGDAVPALERVSKGVYVRRGAPATAADLIPELLERGGYPERDPEDEGAAAVTAEAAREPVAAPSRRSWVMGKFGEQRLWTVRALVDAWVKANGGDREAVRSGIAKVISERMAGNIKSGPQLIRVSQGLYEAVG